ncbi:Hypothetical Protein FCC1311_082202 [Hondaea fermentalgiana]|uniref:PH domain-containing protein n=1 Tax=Hondaea fermentalgiana TaxID=2315210 RepID=A0A2R5GN00_9STRA|nr:Hypothetical Protein FCC1311_082202 [Hondaea fermentalgiana]|eukprot:GBG31995.1 Hypothetical Protein FCC1311_082202 [Hondaea fermentalgiana]
MAPLVGAAPTGPSAWSSTDVLRISVEGKGIIGFVEVGSSSNLVDARQKIVAEVDGLSDTNTFQFQLPDGVPISRKQEACILAREFLPVIHLRTRESAHHRQGSRTPTGASASAGSGAGTGTGAGTSTGTGAGAGGAPASMQDPIRQSTLTAPFHRPLHQNAQSGSYVSSKVTVSFLGEPYHLWVTTGYTFAQLRREAARYWSFPSDQVVLMDEDGCAWPDSAIISAVLATGMLDRREILLVRKPGTMLDHEGSVVRPEFRKTLRHSDSPRAGPGIRTSRSGPRSPHHAAGVALSLDTSISPRAGAFSAPLSTDPERREVSTLSRHHQQKRQYPLRGDTEVIEVLSQPSESDTEAVPVRVDGQNGALGGLNSKNSHTDDEEDVYTEIQVAAFDERETLGDGGDGPEGGTGEEHAEDTIRDGLSCEERSESLLSPGTHGPSTPHAGGTTAANVVMERYADLWRAFTYYCAQIDSNRPFSMDRRGFYGFLQDCNLVDDHSFTPAKLNLIFTATCKSGSRSNRMCFADFLDALMMLARKIRQKQSARKPPGSPSQRHLTAAEKAQEEYTILASFVQLLTHVILPRAATWNLRKWDMHADLAERPEVLATLQPFVKPFYEIFGFYAPAVPSNKLDMETDACFYWPTFSTFSLDFQFAELNIRPWLAEIYVCAASQVPLPLKGRASSSQGAKLGFAYEDADEPERSQPLMTQQRYLLQHASGDPIWERPTMRFGQFLGALLRVAWYAFPDLATGRRPELAVKALVQHFSKCLRKSYVMDIVEKRKDVSKYPHGLLSGTKMLYKRYVDMWKHDGQPDYLSDEDLSDDEDNNAVYHVTDPEQALGNAASAPLTPGALSRASDWASPPANRRRSLSAGTKRSGGSASNRRDHAASFLGDGRRVLEQLVAAEEARTAGGNPNGPAVAALLGLQDRSPTHDQQQQQAMRERSRSAFGLLDGDDEDDAEGVEHRLEGLFGSDQDLLRGQQSPFTLGHDGSLGNTKLAQGGSLAHSPARAGESKGLLARDSSADVDPNGKTSPRCSVSTQSPRDFGLKPIDAPTRASATELSADKSTGGDRDGSVEKINDLSGCLDSEEKDNSGDSEMDSSSDDADTSTLRSKRSMAKSSAGGPTSGISTSEAQNSQIPHLSDNADGSLTLASVDLLGRVSQPTYELLCHGGVFLKHGRRGYPHRRFVWCDERLQRVYWCPVDRKPSKSGPRVRARSLAVQEITQVTDGLQTDRLQRLLKPNTGPWHLRRRSGSVSSDSGVEIKRSLCFSLHGKDRTLDLEADDGELRGEWIGAFEEILRLQRHD